MKDKNFKKGAVWTVLIIIAAFITGNEVLFNDSEMELAYDKDPSNSPYEMDIETESTDREEGVVNRVIDGDTIVVGANKHIRLLGINAPEKGECFAEESKNGLSDLVLNEKVDLKTGEYDRDNFGRLLRYVFLSKNDLFVNDYMVDAGLGEFDGSMKDKTYKERLRAGESQAKRKNIGMWGECLVQSKEGCDIRGNISEDGYGKIYFMPGDPNYERVQIDANKGEKYFCSEEEAKDAGFRSSQSESQLKYMK